MNSKLFSIILYQYFFLLQNNVCYFFFLDPRDGKALLGFETGSGRNLGTSGKDTTGPFYQHKDFIRQVSIQQEDSFFAFLDASRDVFIAKISAVKCTPVRILSNVESIMFSNTLAALGCVKDSQVQVVMNPAVAIQDPSLLMQSTVSIDMNHLCRAPKLLGTFQSKILYFY